jgi:predicted dehydrogenase
MTQELRTLGCALIGPGAFGRGLAQALVEDARVRLVGVLGATSEESTQGAAVLGGRAFANLDELLQADDVQAVLIATPSDTHAELAIAAAQAGKHIFVEKPMALTVAECDMMIAAAQQANVTLMVGQVQRLFPLLADARRLIHDGAIGRPLAAVYQRHDMLRRAEGSWLQQRARVGGVLHQSTIHDIDWLRTVLGPVAEVFSRAAPVTIQRGLDFPDAVQTSLRFENGCIATHSACMTSYVEFHGGSVFGSNGSLSFSLTDGTLRWADAQGRNKDFRRDNYTMSGHTTAIREELRAFVDAALGLAPALIPGEEGRANVEFVQAALISISEGRPVALPLTEALREQRVYLEIGCRGEASG